MLPIEAALIPELRQRGFKRKSRTWWRQGEDAVQVFNLQRGFGDEFFFNLGAYFRELGNEEFPPEHHCHVRARLERVSAPEYFTPIRSVEASVDPPAQALQALFLDGMSWLALVSSKRGLKKFLESKQASSCLIFASAKELCHAQSDA
ncbi:MAG: DUF4304 domain-containing protein [Pseudomonadota bacterium]